MDGKVRTRAGIVVLWFLLIGAVAVLAVFTFMAVQKNNALDSRLSSTEEALTGSQSEITALDDTLRSVDQDLADTKATVDSQAADLRTTKGELAGTETELEATKAQVRTTVTQLTTTSDALAIAEETLAVTVAELRTAEANARETEHSLADTQDRLTTTDEALASANADLTATNEELASTRRDLASTNSDVQTTKQALGDTQRTLADTSEALGVATSDIASLETQVAGASLELTEIRTAIGSVERLREEAIGLETEIAELREQREPLILDTVTTNFACTGSMEPKVGCTDSALWLRNYDPADIVEGAFVSFSNAPDACLTGNTEGRHTAHRVIDIRERNGERQFRTQGDNNPQDDGCWLSAEHINYYVIEFYEDTHPERQWLRDDVNGAVDTYRAALDEYDAYLERHCTLNRTTDRYRCRDPYYGRAIKMHRELQQLTEVKDCWVDHARNYDWWASGGIPIIPPCSISIASPNLLPST